MFSLLQQTAPVVVEETETVIITETAPDAAHGVAVHGADAAHAAGHAASAPGMPQLDITTFGNQIFWLLVVLGVIYWVLSRVALPRIGGVISDRQGAITGDLMAAEEFKQKAKDAEAAYDKALADARAEANKIVAANKAEIQKELDAAIAHADAEIAARATESERRIGQIRASAVEDARTVARDVTEALVQNFGGQADPALVNQVVDQRLKGVLQ
ncbi:F0F1 ATP synthase subunit B' [Paracoccus yeei]|uniref:ATP synthase subunit b n=1 Tax=Paracoccus yeei TaxID=147645 RepID=A0A386UMM0_9RHOB|nr:F0F1 ATP synthase subunit B' [Paracoccus yeei]AYF01716.1 F0F1 ATP synthase subunit B' [Paracoccus yeei]QEU09663.1 F0F1 ATP synthase subunit B' [Paracoccus yeei]